MKKIIHIGLVAFLFIFVFTVFISKTSYAKGTDTKKITVDYYMALSVHDADYKYGFEAPFPSYDGSDGIDYAKHVDIKLISGTDIAKFYPYKNTMKCYPKKSGTAVYQITQNGVSYNFKLRVYAFGYMPSTEMYRDMKYCCIYTCTSNKKTITVPSCIVLQEMAQYALSFRPMTITSHCFSGDKIKVIKLPKSIEYIEKDAFDDCPNLKKVVIHGKTFTPKTLYKMYLAETWKDTKYEPIKVPPAGYTMDMNNELDRPISEFFH